MSSPNRVQLFFLVALGVVTAVVLTGQSRAPEVSGDWPMYSHSLSGQRYSPLTEITPANVERLAPAWTLAPHAARWWPPRRRTAAGRTSRRRRPRVAHRRHAANPEEAGTGSNPQVTPIVIDGVMYLPARGNQVLALDADTRQGECGAACCRATSRRRRAAWRTGPATRRRAPASC